MPEEADSSRRFANDLRSIREERGIALDAIHDETKIPRSLLEDFEETCLADHPMFNRVYLRSLVRAYAGIVSLPVDRSLDLLDDALDGRYEGGLDAVAAEEREAAEEEGTSEETEASGEEDVVEDGTEAPPSDDAERALEQPSTAEEKEERGEEAVAGAAAGAAAELTGGEEAAAAEPEGRANEHVGTLEEETPEDEEAEPSWEATSPAGAQASRREETPARETAVGARDTREGTRGTQDASESSSMMPWVWGAAAVVVIGLVVWGLVALTGSSEDEGPSSGSVAAVADTASVEEPAPPEKEAPAPSDVSLGDTMNVVVVADRDKVQRILIQRDDDLRRPYWIEQGRAKQFPALDRIVLENQLDKIRLLLEGYSYPTDQRDDEGRIVITRNAAQTFLDSVSGPPQPTPERLEVVPKGPIRSQ